MRKLIIYFLILSPLIDYTYKLRYVFGGFELSPNRFFKLLPLLFLIFYSPINPNKVFLWKYAFLLCFTSFFSALIGVLSFPIETIDVYIRFLSSFVFIFLAGKLLTADDYILVLRSLVFISLIPIAISYLQFLNIVPYTDFDVIGGIQIGRVSGGYEKQVAMMAIFIYSFSFVLFYLLNSKSLILKMLCAIYIILIYSVIILSTHRASLIIFTLILFYFLYLYNKKYLLLFVFIFTILIFQYLEFLKELFPMSSGFIIGEGAVLRGRSGFWKDYINNLLNSGIGHIIIGKGNAVLDTAGSYLPELFNEPHSDFVRIFYQYGLIGFILYVSTIVVIIKRSFKFRRNVHDLRLKLLGDMGIIIGVCLILYSITIEPTRYPAFWMYYAAIASYILVNRDKYYLAKT